MITIPENKKLVYDKVNITINVGDSSFSEQIKLREGTCVGVKVIDFTPAVTRDHSIDVAVTDSRGTEVTGATDFRDYKHSGGGYLEGLKPVKFDTRSIATVTVIADKVIAGTPFVGQFVFAVLIDC